MPLGPGVRYRVHKTPSGKKIRLAFQGHKVIEAKNLATGAVHTPAEFAADRAKSRGSLAQHLTALRARGAFRKGAGY